MNCRGATVVSAALACSFGACTFPAPKATLPSGPYVAVLSGQMPPPIDQVARHSWIVVATLGGKTHRYEYGGGGGEDPFSDFASGDVMLHGVVTGTPAEIEEIDRCLSKAEKHYYERHPNYFPIPGPNSNTFVAELDRDCGLGIELPATAIGRDYVGIVGANVTEGRTGIELGSIPLGLRIGIREGVSVTVFGLTAGVHLVPLGIDVPVNPGRVGFANDMHTYRAPKSSEFNEFPEGPMKNGAASVTLSLDGFATTEPKKARGLQGLGVADITARVVYGHYVGYAAGLDFEVGAAGARGPGPSAGLAGGAHLYPLGVGVMLSPTGFLAILSGIGASGVTGMFPSGLELPVEERLEIDLGHKARLGGFTREAFTVLEPERRLGLLGRGEFACGLRARLGDAWGFSRGAVGSGYFFGFERREIGGGTMLGFVFGTELDAGYDPDHRPRDLVPE